MEGSAHVAYRHNALAELWEGEAIYVAPMSATRFRTASCPHDYAEAQRLIRMHNWPEKELTYPTFLAERGGDLVGVMCTRESDECILAGPLALAPGVRRPILALTLLREYERHMRERGIMQVVFDMETGSEMHKAVHALWPDLQPFGSSGPIAWYTWAFNEFSLIDERSE